MMRLYLYSSMKFDIGIPITWILTADGQYSFQNLYGVDQQSLGGEWTVRGFRESTISGDDGFYVRNDVRLPLWNLLPDALTDAAWMNAGGGLAAHNLGGPATQNLGKSTTRSHGKGWSINSALERTQLAFFADYGYVRNRHKILPDPYDSNSGAMAGVGVGLHYGGRYLNWSLMYARVLSAPEYLQTRDGIAKEEQSIHWRFGLSY
jgi:hemolysin activation/secretion protein